MIGPLRLSAHLISWEWVRLSKRERKREQEASGGCLSENLAWSHSGCLEWAFFCLQRANNTGWLNILPTHSLFSLGCCNWLKSSANDVTGANGSPTDGSHSTRGHPYSQPNMDRKSSYWTTASAHTATLPRMNQSIPLTHSEHNVPWEVRINSSKPFCGGQGGLGIPQSYLQWFPCIKCLWTSVVAWSRVSPTTLSLQRKLWPVPGTRWVYKWMTPIWNWEAWFLPWIPDSFICWFRRDIYLGVSHIHHVQTSF